VDVEVTTIAVARGEAPDPRAFAGLLAIGFDLVDIEDIAGEGHVLRFHRPRPPRSPPRPRPIRAGWLQRGET
jgi:hypothetical protein